MSQIIISIKHCRINKLYVNGESLLRELITKETGATGELQDKIMSEIGEGDEVYLHIAEKIFRNKSRTSTKDVVRAIGPDVRQLLDNIHTAFQKYGQDYLLDGTYEIAEIFTKIG